MLRGWKRKGMNKQCPQAQSPFSLSLTPVSWALPIQLITRSPFASSLTDPLSSLTQKRSAVIFPLPETYLGFAEAFRSTAGKARILHPGPAEYLPHPSDKAFEKYRQRSGDAVVKSLEEMYLEGVPPEYSWEIKHESQTETERRAVAKKGMLPNRAESAALVYATYTAHTREIEEYVALHRAVCTCQNYQALMGEVAEVLEAIRKFQDGEGGAVDESEPEGEFSRSISSESRKWNGRNQVEGQGEGLP